MTSNGYRNPAPDPGLCALSDLLQGLHERGMSVGVDDAARVARAFAHAQDWPRQRRVRALKALLARSDDERRLIDQLEQFLFVDAPREELPPESERPPDPQPDGLPMNDEPLVSPEPKTDVERVPSRPSSRGRWAAMSAVAVATLAAAATMVSMKESSRSTPKGGEGAPSATTLGAAVAAAEVPLSSVSSVAPPVLSATPPPAASSASTPDVSATSAALTTPKPTAAFEPKCTREPDVMAQRRRIAAVMGWPSACGLIVWLVCFIWRCRRGRRQEQNVARLAASTGPRVYRFDVPDSESLGPVESALLRDAAFQLSAPRTEVSAAWIDVRATISDTVSQLGLLSLRFDRWREQAPVIVLEDVGDGMSRWPLHGKQLVEALERQGAEVIHYFFDREPGQIHKDRWLSQAMELDRALCASPQALVIVVSDASGIEPARGGSRSWMGHLSSCLWLHPAPEALWGRGARWLGARLRVAAMSPEGLSRLGAAGLRAREALAPAWQPPVITSGEPMAVVAAWRGVLSRPRGSSNATDETAFCLLCASALLAQRAGLSVRLLTAMREQLIDAPWDLTERIWSFPTLSVGHDGTIKIDPGLAEVLIGVLRKEQPLLSQRVVDWAKSLAVTTSRDLESWTLAQLAARVTSLRLDAESDARRNEALNDVRELGVDGFGDVISGYASEAERQAWGVRGLRRIRRPTGAQWVGAAAATVMAGWFVLVGMDDRVSAKFLPSEPRFSVLTAAGSVRVADKRNALIPAASLRPEVYLCDELWLDSKLDVRVSGEPNTILVADQGIWNLGAQLTESLPPNTSRHVSVEFGYQGGKRYRSEFELGAPPIPIDGSLRTEEKPPNQLKGPRMVQIPAGTFQMGSNDGGSDEKPVHPVEVASMWMDVTEVTVGDYEACVKAKKSGDARGCEAAGTGYKCNSGESGRDKHPINCVAWNQARAYCSWAGKRLPTEEEWEYAARGSDSRDYPWGNEAPQDQLCWMRTNGTCPVGSFPNSKSPFGILDMGGNVWEWTETMYCDSYAEDKKCFERRVYRGGSWNDEDSSYVGATNRDGYDPSDRVFFLGFRCAR